MTRWIAILLLAASTWGVAGCGGTDQPKTDAKGEPAKAPEAPPSGV